MGILGLSKLIADVAPGAIKENEMKNYFGRKVAIDASMSLYQVYNFSKSFKSTNLNKESSVSLKM